MTATQAEIVEIIRRKGLTRFDEPVQLSSGAVSEYFVDAKAALSRGPDLEAACRAILDLDGIRNASFDAVGGLTMGADQFAHVIAVLAGCEWFVVRKQPKGRGTNKVVEGAQIGPGTRVLLVEDAVTTGGSIQKAYDVVRGEGATVVAAVTLVDRGDVASAFFEARQIPYYPLITYRDLDIAPVGDPAIPA